jgi:hypothetical protein
MRKLRVFAVTAKLRERFASAPDRRLKTSQYP